MPLTLDFGADQAVINNQETVTYSSVATAGNTTISITDAAFYRTPSGLVEGAPSQGVYVKATGRFAIRASLLSAVGGAKPADTITRADSSVWTVLRAMPPVISGVWQIDVIDLILSNGLVQSGTLSRPSNTEKDSAGRQKLATYTTVASAIPCRVQPMGGEATNLLDRRGIPEQFTAYLGVQLVAQAKDVFVCNGQAFTVLGFKEPQRIDELMTLSLETVDMPAFSPPPPPPPPPPVVVGGNYFGVNYFG